MPARSTSPYRADHPVGSHVHTGSGLASGAFAEGRRIGAEALQVFVGNPRGWALSGGNPLQDREFRTSCERSGIPAYVHTPYLVNLGSPNRQTYDRSVASVAHNLARAYTVGARGVVVHTGSSVDGDAAAGLRRVRAGLLPLLAELPDDGPLVLLEPTAGQGRSLCAGIDELPAYLDALDRHPAIGICLDTCHVFAAGEPLDEPDGATRALDRLETLVGPGRLRLVHANDAMDARGSARDRHERIGRGRIGIDAFAELFAHPAMVGVPMILETPHGPDDWKADLVRLKRLRAKSLRAAA